MGEPRRLEEDLLVPRSWQLRHLLLPTYTRTATQTSPNHGLLSLPNILMTLEQVHHHSLSL